MASKLFNQRILIVIDTENAAFEHRAGDQVAAILRHVAARIAAGDVPQRLQDENGNTVGAVTVQRLRDAELPAHREDDSDNGYCVCARRWPCPEVQQ